MNKEQQIRKLDERSKCRDKISIWFESKENFYHPVLETIVNAIDEISNNFKKGSINVTLHEDNQTITIKDTGRGIPIDETTDGESNVELLFRTLFAGGKYEQTDVNAGLNGCGNTVTCYTSDYMRVQSNRTNGKSWVVEFENGGDFKQDLTCIGKCKNTGTEITFKLSNEVYSEVTFCEKEIEEIVKRFSACSNKIVFTFKYKDYEKEYYFKDIKQYYEYTDVNSVCTPITYKDRYVDYKEFVDMDIVLGVSTNPVQCCFLNNIYLRDGGSINEGIINGIRLYINKYLKNTNGKNKHKKVVSSVTNDDVKNSISFIVSTLSDKVEYRSQAKFATEKRLYKTISQQFVMQLMKQLEKKHSNFDKFMSHICTMAKFNQKIDIDKKKLQKKLSDNINNIDNRVGNLVDCKQHGPGSQLFVAEGQSALGSIVLARDANHQACYPLRGKILNCLKASWKEIFENQIITDLIKVLGCGTEYTKDFDIDKLRFDEIVIACDEDMDGAQIQVLVLTMLYKLMPELIVHNKVKILQTPLFEIEDLKTKKMYYAKNEQEKNVICSKLTKFKVSRNKGLGEVDPDVMSLFMKDNSNTPTIVCPTIHYCEKQFNKWMGDDVTQRKQHIENNLDRYVDLSE